MDWFTLTSFVLAISSLAASSSIGNDFRNEVDDLPQDAIPKLTKKPLDTQSRAEFKYKYLSYVGNVYEQPAQGLLEISSTLAISNTAESVGISIIRSMIRNMPVNIFLELAYSASVGLFTAADKTTIFPEYEHLRDRPECAGTCAGACSDTCTPDGRKWDSLAGVGGVRATCLDDNFMCRANDPYQRTYSVLVHEFAHTVHLYSLPRSAPSYYDRIENAWRNAYANRIWDVTSYAMSNSVEYFAEASATFLNASRHPSSSGGMNGCGKPSGQFCNSESEARAWLLSKDPELYNILSFVYTNNQPSILSGLSVCVA